jgi:hypothetical protein
MGPGYTTAGGRSGSIAVRDGAHLEPPTTPARCDSVVELAKERTMSMTRTGPGNILYVVLGALVVIAAGLAYYVYDQTQRGPEVEIRLEVPKIPTTN